MSEKPEGWYHPRTSKRAHYAWRERSLCNRYGAYGISNLKAESAEVGKPECRTCRQLMESSKSE